MEFLEENLSAYCDSFIESESELLNKVNRETHLNVMMPRMLSGHGQGRFLSFISKLKSPKSILEIGTYTGYSALCLAEGLQQDGKLITLDSNEETCAIAKRYFDESEYKNQIELKQGNALEIIPALQNDIDLVFIDADKINYPNYFDLVIDKVSIGGMIIADNVLWSGKVLADEKEMDKDTLAIHNFNKKVNTDHRVLNYLLPIRDGLMLMIKN